MSFASHWQLNPDLDFLNHGSFGAVPTIVLQAQRRLQDALERDPIRFLAPERELEPKLDHVRAVLSELVAAPASDLAFVHNATDGVNAVVRSMSLVEGDEIVVTNHGYNACNNAAQFAADRSGAKIRVAKIPFPLADSEQVVRAIETEFSDRTRLVLVDHITSPTGLVFPIEKIVASAHADGIRVLVDGAHAPGMVPIDLQKIDADYYTANHHKWLCAPKASGFLYVRREFQDEVRPTVISHAANRPRPRRSRFLAEFDWNGTFDPTPLLSVPHAIKFLGSLFPGGVIELMSANRQLALEARRVLCDALQIEPPSPAEMIGSLVAVPLPPSPSQPTDELDPLQVALYNAHRFEVPVFAGPEQKTRLLRVSLQAYNHIGQIERLADVLRRELSAD
jgi:isopenicillin-N epimerase